MLYIEREVGGSLVINTDIWVKVVSVSESGMVKLAFDAPKDVPIDRQEVHERKMNESNEIKPQSKGPKIIYKRSKLAA